MNINVSILFLIFFIIFIILNVRYIIVYVIFCLFIHFYNFIILNFDIWNFFVLFDVLNTETRDE